MLSASGANEGISNEFLQLICLDVCGPFGQEAKERFTCQICFEEWRLEKGATWRNM